LHQAVLTYAVSQKISTEEEREMGELFKSIDKNNDGTLTREELKEAFKKMYPEVSENDIETMINEFDSNKDGILCYTEFKTFMLDKK
jgi:Ca2+-binding EF-hand superfamily protein